MLIDPSAAHITFGKTRKIVPKAFCRMNRLKFGRWVTGKGIDILLTKKSDRVGSMNVENE